MNLKNTSLLLLIIFCPIIVSAQKYLSKAAPEIEVEWKNYSFSSAKTFAENIVVAPEFATLSKILKDKSLMEALEKEEMVTIFAFTEDAFSKMNKKQKDSILGNNKLMISVVKLMTVPGRIDKNGLQIAVEKHNGKASLATLNGEYLGVTQKDNQLFLVDSKGRMAAVTATNFYHKNGLFHIVDGLVFPDSQE